MSAQEAVTKMLTASEEDKATTSHAESDWFSPNDYYVAKGVSAVTHQLAPMLQAFGGQNQVIGASRDDLASAASPATAGRHFPVPAPTPVIAQSPIVVGMNASSEPGEASDDASDLDLGVVLGLEEPRVAQQPPAPPVEDPVIPVEPEIEPAATEDIEVVQEEPLPPPAPEEPQPETIVETPIAPAVEVVEVPESTEPATRPYNVPSLGPEFPSYHSQPQVNALALIQQRAAEKAAQRRQRIEARKWLGYAPGRPPANPTPFTGGTPSRPAVIAIPYPVRDSD